MIDTADAFKNYTIGLLDISGKVWYKNRHPLIFKEGAGFFILFRAASQQH